jgi:benzoylformate decarboxylase
MGNIMTAFLNKTPLIIIAGQQTRQMLIGDPYLTNRDATMMPLPWVKWSYEPARAEDVPAALVRAIAIATMPPAGMLTRGTDSITTDLRLQSSLHLAFQLQSTA